MLLPYFLGDALKHLLCCLAGAEQFLFPKHFHRIWALPTTSPFLYQQNADMCLLLPFKSLYIHFSFSLPQKNKGMFPLCFLFQGQEGLDGERGKPGQQGSPVRDAALLWGTQRPRHRRNREVGRAAVGVCGELWNVAISISQAYGMGIWATFETDKWVTQQGALPVPVSKPSFLNGPWGNRNLRRCWWEMTVEGFAWKWSIWCAAGEVKPYYSTCKMFPLKLLKDFVKD